MLSNFPSMLSKHESQKKMFFLPPKKSEKGDGRHLFPLALALWR
jgi:hypothetical protein